MRFYARSGICIKTGFPNATETGYYHFNKKIWKKATDICLTATTQRKNIVRMTTTCYLLFNSAWLAVYCSNVINLKNFISRSIGLKTQFWYFVVVKGRTKVHTKLSSFYTLEAWYRRPNIRKPTLILFLHSLKKETKYQRLKINRSIFSHLNRTKTDITFDRKPKMELKSVNEGEVNTLDFLKNISTFKYNSKFQIFPWGPN